MDNTIINITQVTENVRVLISQIGEKGDPGTGGGGDGSAQADGEFHTGLTSSILTLNRNAIAGTLHLHKAGVRLPTSQYVHEGGTEVDLAVIPETTDEFIADYKYSLV